MRLLPLSVAVPLVLLLAACGPAPDARPTVAPEPTSSALFADEEEALAAAEEALRDYIEISDAIAADGGNAPERVEVFVTSSWLEEELEFYESLQSLGIHQVGVTGIKDVSLQYIDDNLATVTVYACVDVSANHFEDAQGNDVTPATRAGERQVVATFEEVAEVLRLDRMEPWSKSC